MMLSRSLGTDNHWWNTCVSIRRWANPKWKWKWINECKNRATATPLHLLPQTEWVGVAHEEQWERFNDKWSQPFAAIYCFAWISPLWLPHYWQLILIKDGKPIPMFHCTYLPKFLKTFVCLPLLNLFFPFIRCSRASTTTENQPAHRHTHTHKTRHCSSAASVILIESSFSWLWCVWFAQNGIRHSERCKCYRKRMWKTTFIQMERKAIMYFVWCESINSISNTFQWVSFSIHHFFSQFRSPIPLSFVRRSTWTITMWYQIDERRQLQWVWKQTSSWNQKSMPIRSLSSERKRSQQKILHSFLSFSMKPSGWFSPK